MTNRRVDWPQSNALREQSPSVRVPIPPVIRELSLPAASETDTESSLTKLPLFRDLNQDTRKELVRAARWYKAGKHALILAQGDLGFDLYMVVDGCILIPKKRSSGASQIVAILFAGDLFGATAMGRYVYSARAGVQSKLLGFDHVTISTLSDRHPSIRRTLYRSVVSDVCLAQDHLVLLGAMSARERVAVALLQLDRRQQARDRMPGKPLWLPIRRTDLASYLGIELPTLSRVMARFRDHGLIKFQSMSEIQICDRSQLARMTGET